MKILIMAGGVATRMRPYTEHIPKCLVDINGKPLIQHQLEHYKEKGHIDYVFCIGHLADKVKEHFGSGEKYGLHISYVEEKKDLVGTAGGAKLAEPMISPGEDFIVYYGDNLTSIDLEKFMSFHKKKGGIASVAVRKLPPGYKSSSLITLDKDSRIKAFKEKPTAEEIEKLAGEERYINCGIYALNQKIFRHIPENTKYDFTLQLFPSLIEKGVPVYGYVTDEFFREIGRVEKYNAFLKEVSGRKNIFP